MFLPDTDLLAMLSTLSPALKSVWAKSGPLDDDPFGLWLPLVGHAMDSASVSVHLWDSWLSNSQRALVSEGFRATPDRDDKYDQARTFVALAAGIHDIGKISKPFARQVSVLAEEMGEHGLRTASSQSDEARDNRWMKHSLAGALAVQSVGSRLGWDRNATSVLASLAGGHHGTPTQKEQLKAARDRRHYLVDGGGDGPWLDAQCEFAAFVQAYVGSPDLARPVDLGTSALVIIQALVMMADWIASSSTYFPLTPRRDRDFGYLRYSGAEHARVGRALTQLRLPPTWTPADSGEDATALLGKKFGVPFAARLLQAAAVIAARQLPGPGSAGMIPNWRMLLAPAVSVPRKRGDDPSSEGTWSSTSTCSPRAGPNPPDTQRLTQIDPTCRLDRSRDHSYLSRTKESHLTERHAIPP